MKQILIAIDQLANALLGGHADETLSARSWRLRDERPWGFIRKAIDVLFFWERDHCQDSFNSEMERRQLPAEYRSRN